jgi:hypothetical protein
MPPVAASEGGGAQTHPAAEPAGGAGWGLDGRPGADGGPLAVHRSSAEGRWNGPPEGVRVP